MHVGNGRAAREARQQSAAVRQEAREKRTDLQQLRRITLKGHLDCKESRRLNDRIAGRK